MLPLLRLESILVKIVLFRQYIGLFKKLNLHLKKSLHADEQDSEEVIAARKEFLEKILEINLYALNFLDESATRTDMTRKYGRSYKGKRCVDSAPGSWKTLTLMASFNLNGDISPVIFPGALNRITFEKCLEKFILPSIKPGHTLVLDNLSSHKSELITKLCKNRGVNLIYLPPYSPDLNPIVFSEASRQGRQMPWSRLSTRPLMR